jgi:hypothetical protein
MITLACNIESNISAYMDQPFINEVNMHGWLSGCHPGGGWWLNKQHHADALTTTGRAIYTTTRRLLRSNDSFI